MLFTFFTSAFCEPCTQTRTVLVEAKRLLPHATVQEIDVANEPERAEAMRVRNTPTIIVADSDGTEVFRASGVPTLDQVLVAAAKAL